MIIEVKNKYNLILSKNINDNLKIIKVHFRDDSEFNSFLKDFNSFFNNNLDVIVKKYSPYKIDYNKFEWFDMPEIEYNEERKNLCFINIKYNIDFFDSLEKFFNNKQIKITKKTNFIWYPNKLVNNFENKYYTSNKIHKPKYNIYIISLGRYKYRTTAKYLDWCGIDYKIVIEPNEKQLYIDNGQDPDKILTTPENYSITQKSGSIPVRNFVLEYDAKLNPDGRHWILDDNISGYYRFNKNKKILCKGGFIFTIIEDFVDRYENIKMAGHQYYMFCVPTINKPYIKNTRIFSSILLSNDILKIKDEYGYIKWRGKYNEDVDLSIRLLKNNYPTILFYCILANKLTTLSQKGGNTNTIYGVDNINKIKKDNVIINNNVISSKINKVKQLIDNWKEYYDNGILKQIIRYGRPHHKFDFSIFKNVKLIWKSDLKDTFQNLKFNNYNIELSILTDHFNKMKNTEINYVELFDSPLKTKKYMVIFYNNKREENKRVHFGAKGMSDLTIHKDEKRKERYLNRHRAREDWNDPYTAGALSRWILWNKPTLKASWNDYKKRFGFK
jgi:hypothetical protein